MNRILRQASVVAITLASLMLYGCSSDSSSSTGQDDGSSTSGQSQNASAQQPQALSMPVDSAAPVAISATEPQVFEGQGSTQTARFDITDGILYMKASHQGMPSSPSGFLPNDISKASRPRAASTPVPEAQGVLSTPLRPLEPTMVYGRIK